MAQPDITMTAGAAATPPNNTIIDTLRVTTSSGHIQSVLGGGKTVLAKEWRFTASQVSATLVTASATERVAVTAVDVTVSSTSDGNPAFRIGLTTGSVTATGGSSSGVAGIFGSHPGLGPGSGFVKGTGAGIIAMGSANQDVKFGCTNPIGTLCVELTYLLVNA